VTEALERARDGGGPAVIEAMTYRLSDHTTSDDATRYRAAGEVDAAQRIEPLIRTRAYLEARGLWDGSAESALRRQCGEEVDAAVKQYLATPKQSTDSMFDYLYAQLPPGLRAQREDARHYSSLKS
jgi:pyruvate dehydrogenase E1 component alpha subunit